MSKALLWCRCAPPQPPNPTQARAQNGVAGAECPKDKAGTPERFNLEATTPGDSIGNQVAGRVSLDPGRTRPAPVAGLRHEATPDWVQVDVVDHRHQRPGFPDVPIETATGLPNRTGRTAPHRPDRGVRWQGWTWSGSDPLMSPISKPGLRPQRYLPPIAVDQEQEPVAQDCLDSQQGQAGAIGNSSVTTAIPPSIFKQYVPANSRLPGLFRRTNSSDE